MAMTLVSSILALPFEGPRAVGNLYIPLALRLIHILRFHVISPHREQGRQQLQ